MIIGLGKKSIKSTEIKMGGGKGKKRKRKKRKEEEEEEEESKTFGRDGPKAGMVPLTGQLYEFLMGRSFNIFLDLTKSPHPVRG